MRQWNDTDYKVAIATFFAATFGFWLLWVAVQ